jgi:uncharacterized membrane protein YphA (DoxX/SURF4 family)
MKFTHDKSIGLLILRIIIGGIFIMAGWAKVSNMDATVAMFASMGFGTFLTYVASYVELLGGISLVVGYGSKIASALLSVVMIVAIYKLRNMGMAAVMPPLAILGATLALFFTGSGKYGFGSDCGCPVKEGTCPIEK